MSDKIEQVILPATITSADIYKHSHSHLSIRLCLSIDGVGELVVGNGEALYNECNDFCGDFLWHIMSVLDVNFWGKLQNKRVRVVFNKPNGGNLGGWVSAIGNVDTDSWFYYCKAIEAMREYYKHTPPHADSAVAVPDRPRLVEKDGKYGVAPAREMEDTAAEIEAYKLAVYKAEQVRRMQAEESHVVLNADGKYDIVPGDDSYYSLAHLTPRGRQHAVRMLDLLSGMTEMGQDEAVWLVKLIAEIPRFHKETPQDRKGEM